MMDKAAEYISKSHPITRRQITNVLNAMLGTGENRQKVSSENRHF